MQLTRDSVPSAMSSAPQCSLEYWRDHDNVLQSDAPDAIHCLAFGVSECSIQPASQHVSRSAARVVPEAASALAVSVRSVSR